MATIEEEGDNMLKPLVPNINWNRPLSKKLFFCVPFFERKSINPIDIISHSVSGSTNGSGTPTIITDIYGSVASFAGNAYGWPATFSPAIPSVVTIVALINPGGSGNRAILANSSNNGFEFRVTSSNNIELLQQNTASIATSTNTIANNIWSMVAVTYDVSGNYVFYINGVKDSSGTNLKTITNSFPQIGGQPSTEFYTGKVAFVNIWGNRIFNAQEIKQLYTNPWQIYNQLSFI